MYNQTKLKLVNNENSFEKIISNISMPISQIKPYYYSDNIIIYNDDCLEILSNIPDDSIDMIFADPPYMLSNNGFTCQNGKMVTVNKGKWDRSNGFEEDNAFHNAWIMACRRVLKSEGTIWISDTYHSIYQCLFITKK
jgi:site-specific DNA-methyltransferase (adenine-specific)